MGTVQADSDCAGEMDDSGCVQDESPDKPADLLKDGYNSRVQLLDLSDDVLLNILKYCQPHDLKALGFSCLRFSSLIRDRSLWTRVDARSTCSGQSRVHWMIANVLAAHTTSLMLAGYAREAAGCLGHLGDPEDASSDAPDLQTNSTQQDNDTEPPNTESSSPEAARAAPYPLHRQQARFHLPEHHLPRVSSGPVWSEWSGPAVDGAPCRGPRFSFTGGTLRSLAAHCPRLTTLALEYCNINCKKTLIVDFPPSLKKLSLRGTKCYNLPIDKSYMFKIQDHLPNLEFLDLSECEWIEPAALMPISKVAHLQTLLMKDCAKITEFVAYASLAARYGFRKLTKLDLRGCGVGDSEVSALGWLPRLRSLRLAAARHARARRHHRHRPAETARTDDDTAPWERDPGPCREFMTLDLSPDASDVDDTIEYPKDLEAEDGQQWIEVTLRPRPNGDGELHINPIRDRPWPGDVEDDRPGLRAFVVPQDRAEGIPQEPSPEVRPEERPQAEERPERRPEDLPEVRPVEIPEVRPQETPEVRPEERPQAEERPGGRPEDRPEGRSDDRSKVRTEDRPEVRPEERPEVKKTPEVRPDEIPKVRPDKIPEVRPDERPKAEKRPEVRPEQRSEVRPGEIPEARPEKRPQAEERLEGTPEKKPQAGKRFEGRPEKIPEIRHEERSAVRPEERPEVQPGPSRKRKKSDPNEQPEESKKTDKKATTVHFKRDIPLPLEPRRESRSTNVKQTALTRLKPRPEPLEFSLGAIPRNKSINYSESVPDSVLYKHINLSALRKQHSGANSNMSDSVVRPERSEPSHDDSQPGCSKTFKRKREDEDSCGSKKNRNEGSDDNAGGSGSQSERSEHPSTNERSEPRSPMAGRSEPRSPKAERSEPSKDEGSSDDDDDDPSNSRTTPKAKADPPVQKYVQFRRNQEPVLLQYPPAQNEEPPQPAQEEHPRQHILYVSVSHQFRAVYRFNRPILQIRSRNRTSLPNFPNAHHIDSSALVTDSAIRMFGTSADRDEYNVVHIGPDHIGRHVGRDRLYGRPDRSNLRYLEARGYINLTDRSLVHLATAAPHLRYVDFTGTSVTRRGVETFMSLRPDCEVRFGRDERSELSDERSELSDERSEHDEMSEQE